MDWPTVQDFNRVAMNPNDVDSVWWASWTSGGQTAGAWPTANAAIYIPFVIHQPFTVRQMAIYNGTVSGNVDVGVYSDQGNRLVSSGSTAQTGASTIQAFDVTDTALLPGTYYMAMAMDNGTGQIRRLSLTSAVNSRALGLLGQTSAFPLPSSATFAVATEIIVPYVAVFDRTLV